MSCKAPLAFIPFTKDEESRLEQEAEAALAGYPHLQGSPFSRIEALLLDRWSIYADAITFVLGRERTEGHRTLLDAFFYALFPRHQADCDAFLDETGPPLASIVSPEERAAMERTLFCAIFVALKNYKVHYPPDPDLPVDWDEFRELVVMSAAIDLEHPPASA